MFFAAPASFLNRIYYTGRNYVSFLMLNFNKTIKMSKEDIKLEINRVLDRFPDTALLDLLSFLRNIDNKQPLSLVTGDNFKKILSEDKDLLQKLAQ